MRIAYYAFLLGCGLLIRFAPAWTARVTLAESALSITLLVVRFMTPILRAGEPLLDDPFAPVSAPVTTEGIVNFAIAALWAWLAFQRATRRVR